MISKNPLILFVVQHAFLGVGENAAGYRVKMNDQCFSKTISNHSIILKYILAGKLKFKKSQSLESYDWYLSWFPQASFSFLSTVMARILSADQTSLKP